MEACTSSDNSVGIKPQSLSPEQQEVFRKTFQKLKPLCDAVIRDPNRENVKKVEESIDTEMAETVAMYQYYLTFPLMFHLKKHKHNPYTLEILLPLMNCFKTVIRKTKCNSSELYLFYHNTFMDLIMEGDKESVKVKKFVMEDLKYGVLECLKEIYFNLTPETRRKIIDMYHKQYISLDIYCCCELAKVEKLVKLRLASLDCILVIFHEQEPNILKIAKTFIPGITLTCCTIWMSPALHRDVYIAAIRLFERVILLTFKECGEMGSRGWEPSKEDSKWYINTATELEICKNGFYQICSNCHWIVRKRLSISIGHILLHCFRNLNSFWPVVVEVLIILSQDAVPDVRSGAKELLATFLNGDTPCGKLLLESLEDEVYIFLEKMKGVVDSIGEGYLISTLRALDGYLNVLELNRVLKSSAHFDLLISTLLNYCEFKPCTLDTLPDGGIRDLKTCTSQDLEICWKDMKYLNSSTEPIFKDILSTLGKRGGVSLRYYLLDLLHYDKEHCKEIIYLINGIVLTGLRKFSKEEYEDMRNLLRVYMDPVYWDVPTVNCDGKLSSAVLRSNIIQVCLLTDGVGLMAKRMGSEFASMLVYTLYDVAEKAGNGSLIVARSGLKTLAKIAGALGYETVEGLLAAKADLVTYHVISKLANCKVNDDKVLGTLAVVVDHCEITSINVLCDIMDMLLTNCKFFVDNPGCFFNVSKSFVRKLRMWFVPRIDSILAGDANETDDIYRLFLRKLADCVGKKKLDAEKGVDIPLEGLEIKENGEVEVDSEPKTERYVKILAEIGVRVSHIISSSKLKFQLFALEVLMDVLIVVWEHENEFLPLLHKMWPSFVQRFHPDNFRKNHLVSRRAFELLCVMAVTAGDFLKTRVLKEIMKYLTDWLCDSCAESHLKNKKDQYRMSQMFKLQLILAGQLGHLAVFLGFQEQECYQILNRCSRLLDVMQPRPLQEAFKETYTQIYSMYPNLVLLSLLDLWTPLEAFVPPTANLPLIKLPQSEKKEVREKKNVEELLKKLFDIQRPKKDLINGRK